MCLNIKKGTTKQIADKDYYTYKWVKQWFGANQYGTYKSNVLNRVSAPYRTFSYHYNRLYSTKLIDGKYTQHKGFHSLCIPTTKGIKKWLNDITFDNGGHVIVVCKIPKGSEYYLGTRGDIISDNIIIVKPLLVSKLIDQNQNRIDISTNTNLHKYCHEYLTTNYPNNLI